jgi:hypothetical protein
MTTEQLQQMLHAQPFQPFDIRLADGRSVRVGHRDFAARSPSGRTVIVYEKDESFKVIDLLLVVSLDTVNGHTRRRPGGPRKRP